MLEDRGDDGLHGVAARDVEVLERSLRRSVRRPGEEVAPELPDEEARVVRIRDGKAYGVLPRERAAMLEDRLCARVVRLGVVPEVDVADAAAPVVAEAGERTSLLADVGLGVPASGPEREELHHLARIVLVRRPARVVAAVQPEEHRGVFRDVEDQLLERAETVVAEQLVLVQHQPLRADAGVRRREPVVPDERHALDERARRAHHAVEPPAVVLAPRVIRSERVALFIGGRCADELLTARVRERADRTVEPERRELLRFALARAEAGAPEQPLCLGGSEASVIGGDLRQHPSRPASVVRPAPSTPKRGKGLAFARPFPLPSYTRVVTPSRCGSVRSPSPCRRGSR